MQGVFLDTDTLVPDELDFTAFDNMLSWTLYPQARADQRVARLDGVQVVVTNKVVLDAATLKACPSLKLICICATGTNNVDLQAAADQGITVCNVTGYARASVAQHTMALLLSLAARLTAYHEDVRSGAGVRRPSSVCLTIP